jgi:hypothetical protein
MNENPVWVIGIKGVAAYMGPAVNNEQAFAVGCEPFRAGCASKTCSGDKEIISGHPGLRSDQTLFNLS